MMKMKREVRIRPLKFRSAIGILILTLSSSDTARADEATKQRFLNEYPAASKAMREKFGNLRCRIRIHEDSEPESHFTEARFWRSKGYDKAEFTRFGDLPNTTTRRFEVVSRKGDPKFLLQKDEEQEPYEAWKPLSNPYRLANLWKRARHPMGFRAGMSLLSAESASSSVEFQARIRFSVNCGSWVFGPFGGDIGQIEEWMSDPSFVLIDAAPLAESPETIEVRLEIQSRNKPVFHLLHLDTSNLWAVKLHRIEIKGTNLPVRTREFRYGPRQNGFAWPVSAVIRADAGGETRCEFSDWSFEPTPVAEFRPSHYGLSDPMYDWRNPRTQAIAGTAAVCMVLVLTRLIRRRRRRNRETASALST